MATQDQEIGAEIGRKISVGDMGFDKASILKIVLSDQTASHFLCRIVGVATGVKPYKVKEGERQGEIAFGLQGQFEGMTADGEVKQGVVAYLPGYVNDMVVSALTVSEDVSAVKIGFDIYAEYSDKSATSYVFTVRDLMNSKPAGVEEVKAQIAALPLPKATPALAAPKK